MSDAPCNNPPHTPENQNSHNNSNDVYNDLEVLKNAQNDILLAEMAAWLHDWRKCSDENIKVLSSDLGSGQNPDKKFLEDMLKASPASFNLPQFTNKALIKIIESKKYKEFLFTYYSFLKKKKYKSWKRVWINYSSNFGSFTLSILPSFAGLALNVYEDLYPGYLNRCHGAAHVEKEDSDQKQLSTDTRLSSPFGFEFDPLIGLTDNLKNLPWDRLSGKPDDRKHFLNRLKIAFTNAPGDTRRPTNEVTLYDWSFIVAALYKGAVAKALLSLSPENNPNNLKWRLLSIRFDGMSFWGRGGKIPDLLARRMILDNSLDRVKKLIEVEYPMGLEVYRDVNGSVFVVPDIACLLSLEVSKFNHDTLKKLINEKFGLGTISNEKDKITALDKEIIPILKIDDNSWQAQKPDKVNGQYQNDPPPISDHLKEVRTTCDIKWLEGKWNNKKNEKSKNREVCPVCGLRPQGPDKKSKDRKVCHVCEKRREDRSIKWLDNLETTIWNDEIADSNGRLALITGKFDLSGWEKNDGYMATLLVAEPNKNPKDPKDPKVKTLSFARMRRLWETTAKFWDETNSRIHEITGEISPRLRIIPNENSNNDFWNGHAYELAIPNKPHITVIFDKDKNSFVTADNLQYIAKIMGANEIYTSTYCSSAMFVKKQLEDHNKNNVGIITTGEYNSLKNSDEQQDKQKGSGVIIKEVVPETVPFLPTLLLLKDPVMFLAMVPANKAVDIAYDIKNRYEKELGKVQNRLPISLGMVFFDRRTPLAAAIDAGKRMHKMKTHSQKYKVSKVEPSCEALKIDPSCYDSHWPKEINITLKREDAIDELPPLKIPILMGDGVTKDCWYPYWNVVDYNSDSINNRILKFTTNNNNNNAGKDNETWVHTLELKEGDTVCFHPSFFDFEFLDTSSRRFEISYDDSGKRREEKFNLPHPPRSIRPYDLGQLDTVKNIWEILSKGLDGNQIYQITGLIEEKRSLWNVGVSDKPEKNDTFKSEKNDTFKKFIEWVFLNANWHKHKKPDKNSEDFKKLVNAAQSGLLAHTAELYLEILKEDIKKEEDDE